MCHLGALPLIIQTRIGAMFTEQSVSINSFDINGADINGTSLAEFETPTVELTYIVPIEFRDLKVVYDTRSISETERRSLRIINDPRAFIVIYDRRNLNAR